MPLLRDTECSSSKSKIVFIKFSPESFVPLKATFTGILKNAVF